jgi:hypothetical protein
MPPHLGQDSQPNNACKVLPDIKDSSRKKTGEVEKVQGQAEHGDTSDHHVRNARHEATKEDLQVKARLSVSAVHCNIEEVSNTKTLK